MILVAGLTPAWQQIAVLDRLRVGEVNRAREVHWCASGKVLNVGLALTQLGANVRTLSLVGSGAAGEATRRDMADLGVDVRWIASSAPQRVCTTLLDNESERTTEIVENSPAATAGELEAFVTAFTEEAKADQVEFVVLTGSLPIGTPRDFYASLLRLTSAKAILDIRGPELLDALPHCPFVIKPNREELSHTVGRPLKSDSDVWQAMRELRDAGAEWVVVTNGSDEVFAVNGEDRWRFAPQKLEVVNPIGCGDCFTAGIAWSLQQGNEMRPSIGTGMAAAGLNATQLTPARIGALWSNQMSITAKLHRRIRESSDQ